MRDQVTHLAHFDEAATLAVTDADLFRANVAARSGEARQSYERRYLTRGRALPAAELLAWWRRASAGFVAAARAADPKVRLPWFGPDMSARSFGDGPVDAPVVPRSGRRGRGGRRAPGHRPAAPRGLPRREDARVSYRNCGRAPDTTPVHVVNHVPSCAIWTYGTPVGGEPDRGLRCLIFVGW